MAVSASAIRWYHRLPVLAAETLVILLGIWGLYSQVMAAAGASFTQTAGLIWLPLLIAAALTVWLFRKSGHAGQDQNVQTESSSSVNTSLILVSAGVVVVAVALLPITQRWGLPIALTGLFALVAVYWACLFVAIKPGKPIAGPAVSFASSADLKALLLFSIGAVAVTAVFGRPNIDDAY